MRLRQGVAPALRHRRRQAYSKGHVTHAQRVPGGDVREQDRRLRQRLVFHAYPPSARLVAARGCQAQARCAS